MDSWGGIISVKLIMDTNALITGCKFSTEGDHLIKSIVKVCHIIIPKYGKGRGYCC